MIRKSDIDLLLIGKTGNGKSKLGNSILKSQKFLAKSSCASVTKQVGFEVTEYKKKIIKVVDGPGVGDTRMTNEKARQMVSNTMAQALVANPGGFHAFLLVVKFGGRFTEEDKETIDFLKNVFATDFVRDYCILVMTCGDNFKRETSSDGTTFDEWCREQEGIFQNLLHECSYRIVLFDNMTENESEQDAQIDELLRVLNSLPFHSRRYTDKNFELAKATRQKALIEAKIPEMRDEIWQETSLIMQKFEEVQQIFQGEEQIPPLTELSSRCDNLLSVIQEEDKGTGALSKIEEHVIATRKHVEEGIRAQTMLAEQRRQMEAHQKEMKAEMDRQMQSQQEEIKAIKEESEEDRKAMEEKAKQQRQEWENKIQKSNENYEKKLKDQLEAQQAAHKEQIENLHRSYDNARNNSGRLLKDLLGAAVKVGAHLFTKSKSDTKSGKTEPPPKPTYVPKSDSRSPEKPKFVYV